MINSSSMGSLKNDHENGNSGHEEQKSGNESSTSLPSSECKKVPLPSDYEENSLTPPSLHFSSLKFDVDGDVEIQSPGNNYSNWESYFAEQLEVDFMNLSPVRNISSPQTTTTNFNNNNNNHNNNTSPQPMQWHSSLVGGLVCSPPRMYSPLGPYGSSSSNKGKGISPLHKVFSSPNNFMHIESLSLPSLETLLDDNNNYEKEDEFVNYPTLKPSDVGYSSEIFENLNVPELLDYFTLEGSSRFCDAEADTSSVQGNLHATTGGDTYQIPTPPIHAPLSQQLLRERMQENQQEHQEMNQHTQISQQQLQNINHTLMMPLNIAPEQEQDSGLQLVHLLLACAEAVAKEDYMLARRYLHHLNRVVTPLGDSMQRVAACFTDALSARLAATLTRKSSSTSISSSSSSSTTSKSFNVPSPSNSPEVLKIYQILYQACPYIKFAHFTANQAIFEAFEAEERVHVIDLDILQGYQWPAFMQALAARPGGPPFLRITGVGPSSESVRETGRCLTELANSLHVPFEFHPVGELLEDLKPHMFNRRVGEALAVNSVNRLHRVPGNSLGNLLAMVRDQAPNIVTIVEQEASHNGPYFLGRFLEALHYYSAIFDSLDATFPADSAQRAKVEQYIFAPDIRNIVACEGQERIVRHERLEKWRKIMEGKGFKSVALSSNAVTQSRILLNLYSCDGYRLTEDKGCLLLGWQDRAVLAASAWRC